MKTLKIGLLILLTVIFMDGSAAAQTGGVVIYNDVNFQGANITLTDSWKGGGAFDRNIKSIIVPPGYRVRIYAEKNYKGTQALLTENWNPGATAWWVGRVRSIRIERTPVRPVPLPAPVPGNFPVIYAQPNFQGPAMAVERDWAGSRDWSGSPHRIRSIRVPSGWKLTLYQQPNFRGGTTTVITDNITWSPTAYWNGRVRSIRVERTNTGTVPPTSGSYPVIYAQPNFQGPAMAVERDFAGNGDWSGNPHQIRSIRVPPGWYLVLYSQRNYGGRSYNLDGNWSPQPGDWWNGRIRSIKVYRGTPPRQPR